MAATDPCGCPVPGPVRAAIARGWRGLTVSRADPGVPVTLVCALEGARIAALADHGLAVGLPGRSAGPGAGTRVALALAGDRGIAMTLDLGFADARAVASRIGADGAVLLMWARAEDARPVRADLVALGPETADRLRAQAARLGEWRVDDPRPEGFSAARWRRESLRPPPARLVRGDLPGAPVAVLAPVPAPGAPCPDEGPFDLELGFPLGPPVPEAGSAIRLGFAEPGQRELAAGLAAQDRAAILVVDGRGGWLAQVELRLGADGRALIADAARGRVRRS